MKKIVLLPFLMLMSQMAASGELTYNQDILLSNNLYYQNGYAYDLPANKLESIKGDYCYFFIKSDYGSVHTRPLQSLKSKGDSVLFSGLKKAVVTRKVKTRVIGVDIKAPSSASIAYPAKMICRVGYKGSYKKRIQSIFMRKGASGTKSAIISINWK